MQRKKEILFLGKKKEYYNEMISIIGDKYKLRYADSPLEAANIISGRYLKVEVVIVDIRGMCEPTLTFLNEKNKISNCKVIPVVILSDKNDDEYLLKLYQHNVHQYFVYPINEQIFKEVLNNMFVLLGEMKLQNRDQLDVLTNVFDKATFYNRVQYIIDYHNPEDLYDMVYINIKNFKLFNKSRGNAKGDQLLKVIGNTILVITDGYNRMFGRMANDNFAMFIEHHDRKFYQELRESIIKITYDEYFNDGTINLVFGIYEVKDDNLSINDMLYNSKIACDTIEMTGNSIQYYKPELEKHKNSEQEIISTMYDALENNEFKVYYQPQMSTINNKISGAEALIRWNKPDGTQIQPNDFIRIFEKTGFIYNIDLFVLETVCRDSVNCMKLGRDIRSTSVNLSRANLVREDFVNKVVEIVDKYNLSYKKIRFEITESAYASNTDMLIKKTRELINKGFILEIDDFGSGFSSIELLDEIPVTNIKFSSRYFHRHFSIENIDPHHNVFTYGVELAKYLGKKTIAEGIETKEQLEYVKSVGSDYVQGYYFAKALSLEDYNKFIDNYDPSKY